MAQAGPISSRSGRFPILPKYEIREELGHGGMATVYRAHDARLGRDVALKVLHPHLRDSGEIAHRFAIEAKAVAKLRHPNIVEVFDVSEEGDGERYLVVELVRGTTLRAVLADRGPLPPEIAVAIALEVLSGLSHAHEEGVVHRDVKPENVLLEHPHLYKRETESVPPRSNPSEKQVRVKLTDFGIAKMLDAQGVTSTGQVLGSPAHMAPEQIDGGEVDARADVFGLGVLLYESMVGHLPFEGSNPAQVLRRVLDGTYNPAERDRPIVGKDWSDALDRALKLDPKDRYASADAMREDLLATLKILGIDDPKAELEKIFSDPVTYEKDHAEKMIAKLSDLGAAARKRGDVQGAANAYNRALAYAPKDAQLLKVASQLAQAEERKRMLRRALPPAAVVIGLGLVAFGVTRYLTVPHDPLPKPVVSADVSAAHSTEAPPPSASVTITRPTLRVIPSSRVVAFPTVSASASAKKGEPKMRVITIGQVNLPAGVLASIDGNAPTEISSNVSLPSLDDEAHKITFTCKEDMCVPSPQDVKAGSGDQTINVTLNIRDAILVIDGVDTGTYRVQDRLDMKDDLRPGAKVHVPMKRGADTIIVKELNSGVTRSVLVRAGGETHADFKSP